MRLSSLLQGHVLELSYYIPEILFNGITNVLVLAKEIYSADVVDVEEFWVARHEFIVLTECKENNASEEVCVNLIIRDYGDYNIPALRP